jgi:hypothetical protein
LLNEQFPDWGSSGYFSGTLAAEVRTRLFLSHLYVLIPVLDDAKHYWVEDEIARESDHRCETINAAHILFTLLLG